MDWGEFWEYVSSCPICGALVHDNRLEEHRTWHEETETGRGTA